MTKQFWFFPLIFAFSLFLFHPSLSYYFFQDDWFVLNWARTGDVASFFKFRTDIIYWRPLSMPIFFAISKWFFGLSPFGFHTMAFLFHFINIGLVYILFRTLRISKRMSLISSFLYATASFHFIPLSWLSTTSYIIGPTFIFLTLIFFLREKAILSLIFFLLGLASTELTLVAIPIILILDRKIATKFRQLSPFILFALIYLLLRLLIFPLPASGQYQINIGPQILTNLFWYFVWTFNIPEKISTIFFFSTLKQSIITNLQFIKYLILPTVLIVTFLTAMFTSKVNVKKIIIGFLWFIFGISPVLFLPKHIFPMYLTVGALGLFYLFTLSLEKLQIKNNIFFLLFCTVWFISSCLTLSFTKETHWIVNEQAISKAYIGYILDAVKKPPQNSFFMIKPADIDYSQKHDFTLVETEENIKQSLNNQDALQVIYNDSSLKSIYTTHQKQPTLPLDVKIFEISPRDN